jgi:hypothetical protein
LAGLENAYGGIEFTGRPNLTWFQQPLEKHMNRTLKTLLISGLAAAALPLGVLGSAARIRCYPDPDDTGCLPTVAGDGEAPAGLNIRSGPGTGYGVKGTLPYEAGGTVICWATGTPVNGNDNWDDIVSPYGSGYVSDYWLYTGGNIQGQVEECPG